jgi:alkylation response protein AidB-like acyl-CoA dehydrogenase
MDFSPTPEQQQLKDALSRQLAKTYTFDARRKRLNSPATHSAPHWDDFTRMGLLGIGIPEELGGMGSLGNGAETLSMVMECFGRHLVLEPYLATVVLCGRVLGLAGSREQQEALLPAIVEGQRLMALAAHERAGRYRLRHVATTATRTADGYRLSGAKFAVLHGDVADTLIVSARTHGAIDDEDGISLFLVDRNAAGLEVLGYGTLDGQRSAQIRLDRVAVPAAAQIGAEGAALPVIERAVDLATIALCAEAVGAMEVLCEQTLEFLKTRKQFGVAIGSFQALQHRMVDMFMACEQARSISMLAAINGDSEDPKQRRRVVSAAKSLIGQYGGLIGKEAIQMHGGMGMTDELPIGHYFKRLTAIDLSFGDTRHHSAVLGDLLAGELLQAA